MTLHRSASAVKHAARPAPLVSASAVIHNICMGLHFQIKAY